MQSLLILPQYIIQLLRRYISIQIIIDHQCRCAIAGAQTGIGKHGKAAVGRRLSIFYIQAPRELRQNTLVSHYPAADAIAQQDHVAADRFPENQVIERGD
jgi:hypothetical protein